MRVSVQVNAGAVAVGGAGWTYTHPIAADGPVTTARLGRSTRLPRPVVTRRGKGRFEAHGGEDPTERAGQHTLEHLSARRAAGEHFSKLIKAGGVHDLLLVRRKDTLHQDAIAMQP